MVIESKVSSYKVYSASRELGCKFGQCSTISNTFERTGIQHEVDDKNLIVVGYQYQGECVLLARPNEASEAKTLAAENGYALVHAETTETLSAESSLNTVLEEAVKLQRVSDKKYGACCLYEANTCAIEFSFEEAEALSNAKQLRIVSLITVMNDLADEIHSLSN